MHDLLIEEPSYKTLTKDDLDEYIIKLLAKCKAAQESKYV